MQMQLPTAGSVVIAPASAYLNVHGFPCSICLSSEVLQHLPPKPLALAGRQGAHEGNVQEGANLIVILCLAWNRHMERIDVLPNNKMAGLYPITLK